MKQSSGAREVARLTALLRKAEMNVSSMEEKIKQKVKVDSPDISNHISYTQFFLTLYIYALIKRR